MQAGEGGNDFMTTGCQAAGGRGGAGAWLGPGSLPHWPLFGAGPGDPPLGGEGSLATGPCLLGTLWLLGGEGRVCGCARASWEGGKGTPSRGFHTRSHRNLQQPQELGTLISILWMRKLRLREAKGHV